MQCPRCGLQNPPGITACLRCGLPAPQSQPAPVQPPQGPQPGASEEQTTVIRRGAPAGQGQPGGPPGQYAAQPPGQPVPAPQQPQPAGQYGGAADRPTYAGGATPSSAWPVTTQAEARAAARDAGATATLVALGIGALLALCYAVWAFTARRGVFADFADGKTVSGDDAKSSDRIDTVLLVIAGVVVVIALALWLMRMVNQKTAGGTPDLVGLGVAMLGVVVVLVGLFLSGQISDAGDQASQGDKGVTATLVTGAGFLLIAVGLLVGIVSVRGRPSGSTSYAHRAGTGYPGW